MNTLNRPSVLFVFGAYSTDWFGYVARAFVISGSLGLGTFRRTEKLSGEEAVEKGVHCGSVWHDATIEKELR